MPGSFVRHVTRCFHGGFWAATLLVAVTAIALNARVLSKPNGLTSRLGRRVTWLLLITSVLVVALVFADMTGLREAWSLA